MGVPVATPVSALDLFRGLAALFHPDACVARFERLLRACLETPAAALVSSGRAALYLLLESMKAVRSSRDEVVVPAFVCPSVARAVVNAGLKLVLCDVNCAGFSLEPGALSRAVSSRSTLAVVAAHLFGYPTAIGPLAAAAHAAGAFVIEDAAQAFGATWNGQPLGRAGDAAIFSFGMSKTMSTLGGGVLVVNNAELEEPLGSPLHALAPPSRRRQAADLAWLAAVAVLVRSHHLGPLARFWADALRGKHDTDDFPVGAYTAVQAAVGRALLPRLAKITAARLRCAAYYSRHLAGISGLRLPRVEPDSEPAFLRFPLVVEDPSARAALFVRLRQAGIHPSPMYDRSSYDALRRFQSRPSSCPHTEYLVDRMVNLPTHPFMRPRDLEAVVRAVDRTFAR